MSVIAGNLITSSDSGLTQGTKINAADITTKADYFESVKQVPSTVTTNGTIYPDSGKLFSQVTVNVPSTVVNLSSLRVDGNWTNIQTKGATVDITGLVPTATFNTSISTPVSTTLSGDGVVSGYTYSPQTWGTDATQTCTFSYTYNSVTKTATKQYKFLAPGDVGPGGGIVVKINNSLYEAIMPDTTSYKWDTSTSTTRGCNTNTSAYAGVSNTNICMSALSGTSGTIWYRLSQYRTSTSDTSWFVPSVKEQSDLKSNCGGSSVVAGWFSNYSIWTSDEYSSSYVWYWTMTNSKWRYNTKTNSFRVVFVRPL